MAPLALAAFVAGAFWLQQQPALPNGAAWLALCTALLGSTAVAALLRDATDRRRWIARSALMTAALASGFGYAALRAEWRLADELSFDDEGRDVVVIGVVDSLPAQLERGLRFELAVERVVTPGLYVPARIAVSWYGAQATVVPAERWQLPLRLRRPHGNLNPGGFDVEAWMLERGLRATGYVRDGRSADSAPRRLDARVPDIGANIDRARHHLRAALQARLAGTRYGGVLVALVLGDQRAIRESDWLLFNATGISHLVSISGLHITMIAGLAAWAASVGWRRSRRLLAFAPAQTAAAVIGMLAALGYCLLAGWGVPAQRTFFMLSVVALAMLVRRRVAPTRALALAAAVVTLIDPWSSSAPGFWLSFGAVAAIFLAMHGERAPTGWQPKLAAAARMQLAVTVALVPLTIALFQQVSLVSPLANAVAIPLVSFVVTPLALLGAAAVLLPSPLDTLALPLLAIGETLFAWLAQALELLAGLGWAAVALPAPPWWALPLALAGVIWLLMPAGWPLRWLGAIWMLPLALWPPQRPAADELWVTAIDVGQGAAVLLETRDVRVLFDSGPRYTGTADAGGRVIAPYLRWRGIGRLDALIVSHLDSDHSGGTASLLRTLPATAVWTSIATDHPMLAAAGTVTRCEAGQAIDVGGLRLRVLHPSADDYALRRSTNAMSCVVLAEFGDRRVLLTGDIPARQEAELLARAAIGRVDLLAAPHHGSRHSSSAELIADTRPAAVLFQAGYRNRFGHPAPEVLARYTAQGALAAGTAEGGALQWRLKAGDGTLPPPRASRDLDRRYWHNQPAERVRRSAVGAEPADDDTEPMPAAEPAQADATQLQDP